jgi:hypothetical protein
MKFYSDIPERKFRQLAGDIWLVIWSVGWIWISVKLHGMIMSLAAPGQAIADGANNLGESIDSAAETIGSLPIVGGALAAPFSGISTAASALAAAGQAEADAVSNLAMFVAVVLAVLAIASFAAFWVPIRLAFIQRASAAQRFVNDEDDLDLFALRALARQPLHVLARISDDPAGDWRRGDRRIIDRLAELELADEGLRMPARKSRRAEPSAPQAGNDVGVVEVIDIEIVEDDERR